MAEINYLDDNIMLLDTEKLIITQFLEIIDLREGLTAESKYDLKYSDPNVRIESADRQQLETALQAIATWVQKCTNAANPPEFSIYQTTQKNYAVNILIDNILKAAQPESFMEIHYPWALLQGHLDSGMTQEEQKASVQWLKTFGTPEKT